MRYIKSLTPTAPLAFFGAILFLTLAVHPGASAASDVAIVPDLPTYIYYISLWDADNQFPIFIEGNKYLDKFMDAYPKAKATKVAPVKIGALNKQTVYNALYAAWGPEKLDDIKTPITKEDLKERLKKLDKKPEGIVLTNIGDMEFIGGLALAAGHKQLLDFSQTASTLGTDVDTTRYSMSVEDKEKLRKEIFDILKSWGYKFGEIGDDIDYITFAMDITVAVYGYDYSKKKTMGGFSLDDSLPRLSPDGIRRDKDGKPLAPPNVYAYMGRVIEVDSGAAGYQAMCSLFLPIEDVFMFDWWPKKYGRPLKPAAEILEDKVDVKAYGSGGEKAANLESWESLMKRKNSKYDMIYIHSFGPHDKWGAADCDDIPDTKPVVVFLAHSNGSRNPKNKDTVIGRWLHNGAYITYGSITEPFASAFPPPTKVADLIVNGETFAKAFQMKENLPGAFRYPWKLIYVGDPLRRLEPDCRQTK